MKVLVVGTDGKVTEADVVGGSSAAPLEVLDGTTYTVASNSQALVDLVPRITGLLVIAGLLREF